MTQLIGKTYIIHAAGQTFTIAPMGGRWVVRKRVGGNLVRVGDYDTLEAAREACK